MNIRTLCLAILNFGDATGYEIKKMSSDSFYCHFVDASFGSIYPALNKLEAEGMLSSREEREPGKPARKIYSITDLGRQELTSHMYEIPKKDIFKSEFLLIAMCAEMLDRQTLSNVIDHQLNYHEEKINHIETSRDETDHKGTHWIANYGLFHHRNAIAYLKDNRKQLESLAKPVKALMSSQINDKTQAQIQPLQQTAEISE